MMWWLPKPKIINAPMSDKTAKILLYVVVAAVVAVILLAGCPAIDFQVATDIKTADAVTTTSESSPEASGGSAGNLPLGYNQLQCGVDACEGPPATTSTYISNPVR